jgi:hypothetical protein
MPRPMLDWQRKRSSLPVGGTGGVPYTDSKMLQI